MQTFRTASLMELDLTRYLLNFERIELGLAPDGEWSVYYTYPCRHLNRHDYTCGVHNTPRQPQVCVSYNPYNCWYKQVFSTAISPLSLRVDRQRLEVLLDAIVFDDNRMIVDMPSWEALAETLWPTARARAAGPQRTAGRRAGPARVAPADCGGQHRRPRGRRPRRRAAARGRRHTLPA